MLRLRVSFFFRLGVSQCYAMGLVLLRLSVSFLKIGG